MNTSLLYSIINLLETCKRGHYCGHGSDDCPAPKGKCDCGAEELNHEIDQMIASINREIDDASL